MKWSKSSVVLVAAVMAFSAGAAGATFSGELVYENLGATNTGLEIDTAPDGWGLFTSIGWVVTDELTGPAGYGWHYEYTVTVQKYELSHMIIEASPNFTAASIAGLVVNGVSHEQVSITTHQSGPGNPNMPEAIYGIKVDDLGGGHEDDKKVTHVISFFSDRQPVWGDVYLKCGGFGNRGWNSGFTENDWDPSVPPADGAMDWHVLVPNAVPEPITLATAAIGGLALLRRRRA